MVDSGVAESESSAIEHLQKVIELGEDNFWHLDVMQHCLNEVLVKDTACVCQSVCLDVFVPMSVLACLCLYLPTYVCTCLLMSVLACLCLYLPAYVCPAD